MEWVEPWWHVAAERPELTALYEREMRAEVGADHPLYDVPVAAIGKDDSCDDVLFQLLDGSGRVAVVHLTWTRHPEPMPWPATEIFPDLESFAELRMRPDFKEYWS